MADYGEGGVEKGSSNVAGLRNHVLTWAARNFEGTLEKPIDDDLSRLLAKRRKKWRKRHYLPSEVTTRPPDPALRSKKECLTDEYYQTGEKLLACRRDGYALCRQLERKKRRSQLQVAESLHQSEIVPPESNTSNEPTLTSSSSSSSVDTQTNQKLLKDLQRALSQVDALVKIKQMKLSMTPRLPPIHRRDCNTPQQSSEQFGMSLLAPPQETLLHQSSPPSPLPLPLPLTNVSSIEANEISNDPANIRPLHSKLPTSADTCPYSDYGGLDQEEGGDGKYNDSTDEKSTKNFNPDMMMNLDPAVELCPVTREQDINSLNEGINDRGSLPGAHHQEELPRIACVMSLMEGQDTASVVEVTADNDVVIETHSSLGPDDNGDEITQQPELAPVDPTIDEERLMLTSILPEKEEIVSTTPDNFEDKEDFIVVDNNAPPASSLTNHITATTVAMTTTQTETTAALGTNHHHKDTNHHQTAEEELVEMIMKDSGLAAWIAKARLRPRTPISYSTSKKKRRNSRSRSSSVHD